MSLHLPAPISQLCNFPLLQLLLSTQSSSCNPFSPIIPLIPSAQVSFGLPRFLLPDGRHSSTPFGSLPSSILWTVRTVEAVSFLRHLKGILSRSFFP
jgi:hypothetical protein